MTDTIFFRLLDGMNRPSRLSDAIEELCEGEKTADTYSAGQESLRQVPNSPLAYWVSDHIRREFSSIEVLQAEGRSAQLGDSTKNDFRFIKTWWEVDLGLKRRAFLLRACIVCKY